MTLHFICCQSRKEMKTTMKSEIHRLVVDCKGPRIDDEDEMMEELLEEISNLKENVLYLIDLFNNVISPCVNETNILEEDLKF